MKLIFTILTLFIGTIQFFAQDFYDINTVQTIEIVFEQSNWDALLDAEMAGDNNYTEAISVTINGELFEQVGVKYKGNSSYNSNNAKNPFHIELDTYVDQDYQGYKDIKLANVFADPSFVRETVAYTIAQQYMEAPEANYANVYVNGSLIGLYTNTEAITKTFVEDRFGSKDNAFFNCSPPGGAGPQSQDFPNLEYLGTNSSNYEDAYDIKSEEVTWEDLIALTDVLNNDVANIETVLDIDRAIWMLAYDNVIVNLDSYIGQFKQNYYLYQTDSDVFNAVVWDLNMSFGTFSMTGEGMGPGGNLNSTTQKAEMDHLLHDTSNDFPLVSKLLSVPTYKKMYLAHFKTILSENFYDNTFLDWANEYQAIIDADVQADNNKFYSYAQFVGNINSDYNIGMQTASGLANLMDARADYLSGLSDFTATQPTISAVESSENAPSVGDVITFTATVINTNEDAVVLGYRTDRYAPFTKIEMFDDGAHNDGAAGDNVYGVDYTVTNDYTHYYVYAENNTIGAFSPARAQHEFYTLEATYIPLPLGDLVINEILASNTANSSDQDDEYDDWMELYNNSAVTVSLDGLFLSDDPEDLLKWEFPDGLEIAAGGYLVVWCDKDLDQEGLHANVSFSSGGESAILSYVDGTVIEEVTFGEQQEDMGYARIPNGTGDFVIQEPSIGANNETATVDEITFNNHMQYFPNPTNDLLNIKNSLYDIKSVAVYNLVGQQLINNQYESQKAVMLDLSNLSEGLYTVVINGSSFLKVVKE